ncbi:hypothetical protein NHQ30_006167 [Ciborinia camelliae]|nr:hypothetical protein NHQ30_006167 [Ciborinia camelliae]
MCLSICHTHTCPHLSYSQYPCRPGADPSTCPYRKKEVKVWEHLCTLCLNNTGTFISKQELQDEEKKGRSQAAASRERTIQDRRHTINILKQAEEQLGRTKNRGYSRRRSVVDQVPTPLRRLQEAEEEAKKKEKEQLKRRNTTGSRKHRCVVM